MNCLEVRRKILAQPTAVSPDLRNHLQQCRACHDFMQRQQSMEGQLRQALNVEIPAGLNARILLRQSLERSRQQRRIRWQALAAGLVLLVSGLLGQYFWPASQTLEQAVLEHIAAERHHLHEQNQVGLASVNQLLQAWGMSLPALPAKVNYAGACPLGRQRIVHLVVEVQQQPVTLIVMPEYRLRKTRRIASVQFNGEIRPFGTGSIAIVVAATPGGDRSTSRGEALVKRVEGRLAQLVPEYL